MSQHVQTDKEKELMQAIANVWMKYRQLPVTTEADIADFRYHFDSMMRVVIARPHFFTMMDDINNKAQQN